MRRAGLLNLVLLLACCTNVASAMRGVVLHALDEVCEVVPPGLNDAYFGAASTLYAAVTLVLIVVLWNGLGALLMQSVDSAVGACRHGGRKAADAPLRRLLIARSKLQTSVRDAADDQLCAKFGGPKVRRPSVDLTATALAAVRHLRCPPSAVHPQYTHAPRTRKYITTHVLRPDLPRWGSPRPRKRRRWMMPPPPPPPPSRSRRRRTLGMWWLARPTRGGRAVSSRRRTVLD